MSRMSSWTGLFGAKEPKLKPDPRIRWFGKLPTYADYYSSQGDEPWVVEFNGWVLEGFEMYLRRSREAQTAASSSDSPHHSPRRLPLASCAIRLPKSGMTAFASVQDYGGDMVGRPFPLCFYVGIPTAQWPGPTSDRLSGVTRVASELLDLRYHVVRFFNAPGGFKSVFEDRRVDLADINSETLDDSWLKTAAGISMTDWSSGTGNDLIAGDLGSWLGLVGRWGEKIAAMESEGFEPTLCFPLAQGIDQGVQTAGWIRWLESRMDLKRRMLSLLVTGGPGDEPRRLVVIARDPTPEDFLLLTPLANTLRYVDDVSRESDAEALAGSLTGDRASYGTWAAFTQAPTHGVMTLDEAS